MHVRLGPVRKISSAILVGRARRAISAVWRSDLDRIDGFDASYVGWGLEDSDLLIRLLRAGVNRKDGRFSTGVLHLWHPLADPTLLSANQSLLDAIQHSDRTLSDQRAVVAARRWRRAGRTALKPAPPRKPRIAIA